MTDPLRALDGGQGLVDLGGLGTGIPPEHGGDHLGGDGAGQGGPAQVRVEGRLSRSSSWVHTPGASMRNSSA